MFAHVGPGLFSSASEGLIWVFKFKTVTEFTESNCLGFSSAPSHHIGPTPSPLAGLDRKSSDLKALPILVGTVSPFVSLCVFMNGWASEQCCHTAGLILIWEGWWWWRWWGGQLIPHCWGLVQSVARGLSGYRLVWRLRGRGEGCCSCSHGSCYSHLHRWARRSIFVSIFRSLKVTRLHPGWVCALWVSKDDVMSWWKKIERWNESQVRLS